MKKPTKTKTTRAPDTFQLRVEFGEGNSAFTTMPASRQLSDPSVLKAAVKLRFPNWTQFTVDYPNGQTEVFTNRRAKK
jgi:hypothetical protein